MSRLYSLAMHDFYTVKNELGGYEVHTKLPLTNGLPNSNTKLPPKLEFGWPAICYETHTSFFTV